MDLHPQSHRYGHLVCTVYVATKHLVFVADSPAAEDIKMLCARGPVPA
jgi:hypothetical protein